MWRFLVVACGLVACGNKSESKQDGKAIAAIREHFDEALKCFARTKEVPKNFAEAVVFATLEEPTKLECEELMTKVVKDTAALAASAKVGITSTSFLPFYKGLPDWEYLDTFCKHVLAAYSDLESLAAAAKLPKRTPPKCELDTSVTLVDGPGPLLEKDRQFYEYWFWGNSVTVLDTDGKNDTMTLGYYDGKTWNAPATPPHTRMNMISTRAEGIVLVTTEDQVDTLQVLESSNWSPRAKLTNKSMAVDNLAMTKVGTTLVMDDFDRHFTEVKWSTDGAKTFGKPTRLPVPKDWFLRTRLLPDGSVVGMMTPHEGGAKFEAFVVAPGDKQATKTASLTWDNPGDGFYVEVCGDGDVVWVLVRARYLVLSKDNGKTWSKVAELADRDWLSKNARSCTADSWVLYDKDKARLHVCDATKCTQIEKPKAEGSLVAIRNKPLEVWFGTEFASVHFRDDEPMQLVVYKVDGDKLARDRVHLVETKGKLPLLKDGDSFLYFRDP